MWNVASTSYCKNAYAWKTPSYQKETNHCETTLQNIDVSSMEPWRADAILYDISVDMICAFFHRLVNFPIGVNYCKCCHA